MTTARTLTTDEVNELMKDWFTRDGTSFTRITAEQKLAWEPTNDSAYSSFLFGSKHITKDSVIRKAYSIARSMLVSMNLPRFVLHIDKTRNCTDGKHIWVSTTSFDDVTIETGEAIDIFIGLTVHEGLHVLETDFSIKPNPKYEEHELKLIHQLDNIFDDERIEMIAGHKFPGTTRYLEKTKYYYFDIVHKRIEEEFTKNGKTKADIDVLTQCMTVILNIIRYPKYLTEEDFTFFGSRLLDIKEALTPYPETSLECLRASEQVYEIIKDLVEEQLKKNFTEEVEIKEEFKKLVAAFIEMVGKILQEANKLTCNTSNQAAPGNISVSTQIAEHTAQVLCDEVQEGIVPRTFIIRAEEDKDKYNESLHEVKRYVSSVKKALRYHAKEFKITHKSMRNGYLDTNKLVDAILGVDTVYETHGEVKTDKVAVCFLIDLSGSMGGSSIIAARQTSILLWEALKDNPSVELFIYGHTADHLNGDNTTDIHVFYEPHSKTNKRHALGSVNAMCCNRDGDAIKECALRIRKRTDKKCLMFVLSDGNPNADNYTGDVGVRETRKQVLLVQRMNFDVVQIAINHNVEPEKMFDKHVIFDDLQSLPKDLNRLIKKTLLNQQKIRIT